MPAASNFHHLGPFCVQQVSGCSQLSSGYGCVLQSERSSCTQTLHLALVGGNKKKKKKSRQTNTARLYAYNLKTRTNKLWNRASNEGLLRMSVGGGGVSGARDVVVPPGGFWMVVPSRSGR